MIKEPVIEGMPNQHLMTPESGRDDEYIPLWSYWRKNGCFAALISNF